MVLQKKKNLNGLHSYGPTPLTMKWECEVLLQVS